MRDNDLKAGTILFYENPGVVFFVNEIECTWMEKFNTLELFQYEFKNLKSQEASGREFRYAIDQGYCKVYKNGELLEILTHQFDD